MKPNNAEPGQMPCSVASDLVLHCLLMSDTKKTLGRNVFVFCCSIFWRFCQDAFSTLANLSFVIYKLAKTNNL